MKGDDNPQAPAFRRLNRIQNAVAAESLTLAAIEDTFRWSVFLKSS